MENNLGDAIKVMRKANTEGIFLFVNNEELMVRTAAGNSVDPSFIEEIKKYKSQIKLLLQDKESDSGKIDIIPRKKSGFVPLSFSQERLWFIDRLEGSVQYHIPSVLRLKGSLDVEGLSYGLREIVNRHEVLRTVIREWNGEGYQHVMEPGQWRLERTRLGEVGEDELREYAEDLIRRPFDLSRDHMLRCELIGLGAEDYVLVVVVHHIASDGWSAGIIIGELVELYEAYRQGRAARLAELRIQYADYAVWQRSYLSGELLEEKLGYWEEKLRGVETLNMPTDHVRPAVQSVRGSVKGFFIGKELSEGLSEVSRQKGVTMFMTLLGVWKILLYRYSGQEDICVGTPVAGRMQQEVEGLVGFFINTLALRSEVRGEMNFLELLEGIRETTLSAYEHQDVPFEKVVEKVVKKRDMGRRPLFQVMFSVDNTPEKPRMYLDDVILERQPVTRITNQFELTVNLEPGLYGIRGNIVYCTDLFGAGTIDRMLGHYEELLRSVVRDPACRIDRLEMLRPAERRRLLEEFNDTEVDYPWDKTVVDLFRDQARLSPGSTALVYGEASMSYGELEVRSNQLGHYLRARGVGPEVPVPICMEQGMAMIVGILGILKAGGAYVPVDPGYPGDRIGYMLEDVGAKLVVTDGSSAVRVSGYGGGIEVIDVEGEREAIGREAETAVEGRVAPGQLAYVIYTSGSTGRPKGVMIEQGNVVSLVKNAGYVSLSEETILLSTGSPSFDATTFEYWGTLLNGGKLVMCSQSVLLDAEALKKVIEAELVTTMWFTAGWFNELVSTDISLFRTLRTILIGGDKLSVPHVYRLRETYPNLEIINGYGPTENTTFSLCYRIGEMELDKELPIGRPLKNRKAYVVGRNDQLNPIGVRGEICVGGAGVARGYWKKETLTAEKFVADPYVPGGRLYRTGDVGRWREDGNIEYIGRTDDQVKVRGYRVELGEIGSVLEQCEGVRQAAVVAREDGQGHKRLVGYVVAEGMFNKAGILACLQSRLPEYMIPGMLVELESLPLTSNGKVDRKGLPEPEELPDVSRSYEAPRTLTEQQMTLIWQELLGVDRVGVNDDFFELGGHSLLATRVVSAMRRRLEWEVPMRALFEYPTVAGLSAHLRELSGALLPKIEAQERRGRIPLSFCQERLWFVDQLEGSVHYHIPTVLRFRGRLNKEGLEYGIRSIVKRHEVLRTVIEQEDGKGWQRVMEEGLWELGEIEGRLYKDRGDELREKIKELISHPFDLSKEHKIRCHLIRLSEEEHVLVVTLHHIASDGWSGRILVEEWLELYRSYVEGRMPELPELEVQYGDYAIWQRSYLEGEVLDQKLLYWKERLSGWRPLELPTDYGRPFLRSTRGSAMEYRIGREITEPLQRISQQEGVTMYMTLLAAFKVLLYRYSGQEDISVGSPVAGRQQVEIEGLIGFFVNTVVVRSDLGGDPAFTELLRQVKERTLEAYGHQEVPFEKVVEAVMKERDMSRSPLFQVMFVMQNNERVKVSGNGIGSLEVLVERTEQVTSKFDLTFSVMEEGDGLIVGISYCTDLFAGSTVRRMGQHYMELLRSVARDPSQRIGELPMLPEEERRELLEGFNATEADYPRGRTLVDLFGEQAARTPEQVAVVYEGQELTYGELDRRSNQLGRYLRKRGVREETLVPICVDRSTEMIVGILGIMKAGGAYVPMDPAYPVERLRYMLGDTGGRLVVSSGEYAGLLVSAGAEELILPDAEWEEIGKEPGSRVETGPGPEHLAYVIYTSGSTGRPKGVMIEHRGMINHLYAKIKTLKISGTSKIAQTSSLTFDISVWQMFAALLNGGMTVIYDDAIIHQPLKLLQRLESDGITIVEWVPSYLSSVLEEEYMADLRQLEYLLVTGEAVGPVVLQQWWRQYAGIKVINAYGPTEASDDICHYQMESAAGLLTVPIGKPIQNMRIYIEDSAGNICPIGVWGQICVSGAGVGRGYLNQPQLTAEKFVTDPYRAGSGDRLYRTGDLGRWLADGNIEYLGRMDEQVKIRGYRIELGEIENVLQGYKGIRQGVVVAKEDGSGHKRLAGYVVREDGMLDREDLQLYLRSRLPEYMVPGIWVELEKLPLTPNGKIDKRSLPDPDMSSVTADRYVAPVTETEKKLCGIWEQLLGVDRVGVEDNFFELGGHSLLTLKLIMILKRAFSVEVAVRMLFDLTTVRMQAIHIDKLVHNGPDHADYDNKTAGNKGTTKSIRIGDTDYYEVTWIQTYWLDDTLDSHYKRHDAIHGNAIVAFEVSGYFDIDLFRKSVIALMERHESLRAAFHKIDNRFLMSFTPLDSSGDQFELKSFDGNTDSDPDLIQRYIDFAGHTFDIEKGRLFLVRIAQYNGKIFLSFKVHHVITDDWSDTVLVRDLFELYNGFKNNAEPELVRLKYQLKDILHMQNEYKDLNREEHKQYWKDLYSSLPSDIQIIPNDLSEDAWNEKLMSTERIDLSDSAVERVNGHAKVSGLSTFTILQATIIGSLAIDRDQTDFLFGTYVLGRETTDSENQIGCYANTKLIRVMLDKNDDFRTLIQKVHKANKDMQYYRAFTLRDCLEEMLPENFAPGASFWRINIQYADMKNVSRNDQVENRNAGQSMDLKIRPVITHTNSLMPIDLQFQFFRYVNGLRLEIQYDRSRYSNDCIQSMAVRYNKFLEELSLTDKIFE